ncbi:hypothetical protein FRC17_005398 [Serendipita sp. 399]|nr:hypothetical protein FRC17_005398 [Serendipita sp. 399]
MAARSIPTSALHIELQIKYCLGEGYMGTVYSTEIVAITAVELTANTKIPNLVAKLPDLCIKVASPTYCRALARDAWFYEQLDVAGLQGITIPHSYGLFSTSLREQDLQMRDWEDKLPEWFTKYDPNEDILWDDHCDVDFVDDAQGNHHSSPWHVWRASEDDLQLSVLLLEQCGNQLEEEEYEVNASVNYITRLGILMALN